MFNLYLVNTLCSFAWQYGVAYMITSKLGYRPIIKFSGPSFCKYTELKLAHGFLR